MVKKTLDCPIIGLTYTEVTAELGTYYTLEPDYMHKMRVRSMDTEDEERNVEPRYLLMLSISQPYDFEKNDMGIEAEEK